MPHLNSNYHFFLALLHTQVYQISFFFLGCPVRSLRSTLPSLVFLLSAVFFFNYYWSPLASHPSSPHSLPSFSSVSPHLVRSGRQNWPTSHRNSAAAVFRTFQCRKWFPWKRASWRTWLRRRAVPWGVETHGVCAGPPSSGRLSRRGRTRRACSRCVFAYG